MWVLAASLGALLIAPHLLPRAQLPPLVGIAMWWSVLVFRVAVALWVAIFVLLYFPASQLFDLLTRWCLHAVVPLVATHLGFSGHRLGDAASLIPALVLLISAASALVGAWRAARSVRFWLGKNALGPGPQDSVLVDDPEVILAAAGVRAPKVVVSAGAVAGLDEAELAAGLQHEWGHVRRLHRLVTLSSSLLISVSRFLPGGRSAFRNLQFHLERDADRYAVSRTRDPLALASAICKVAEARSGLTGLAVSRLDGGCTSDRLRLLLSGDAFHGRRAPSLIGGLLTLATVSVTVALLLAVPAAAESGIAMARTGPPVDACI